MYLPEKHFELLDQKELTFVFQNAGLVESEVDGREYHKFVVMLMHGDQMVFGTTELFPMKQAIYAFEHTDIGLPSLIEDTWYQFEASGCVYDLNFWFDGENGDPRASIYPVEWDGEGYNDTDCSTLIHTISNFQIDYE